jgi:hypothetical protein
MKQYVCIKEYVTEEGDVAYRLGKVYDLEKHKMLASEISGVKYYFSSDFKKTYFKKHKPMTSFGGNGLYVASLSNSKVNGIWSGNITTGAKELMRIDSNYNIKDSVVEAVVKKFQDRSRVGIEKYGTTLDRTDIDFDGWAEHLRQELMDAILYLERLKKC